jgi:hypothetical protein
LEFADKACEGETAEEEGGGGLILPDFAEGSFSCDLGWEFNKLELEDV